MRVGVGGNKIIYNYKFSNKKNVTFYGITEGGGFNVKLSSFSSFC